MANENEKMRATTHNGRTTKVNGVYKPYSTEHNEHKRAAPHINAEMTKDNIIWYFDKSYTDESFPKSIDSQEQSFYEENFEEYIFERNIKARKSRHKERLTTADKYRKSVKSCPEETIFEIGKQGNSISSEALQKIFVDYVIWHMEKYPQARLLNAVLHVDEPESAPHIHLRKVWVATDENGVQYVCQKDALEQMGVDLRDPKQKIGQFNNRKQVYTAECREKFIEIAQSYGYDIEVTPKPTEEVGKSMAKLKKETLEKREADVAKREATVETLNVQARQIILQSQKIIEDNQELAEQLKKQADEQEKQFAERKNQLEEREKNIENEVRKRVEKRMALQQKSENADRNIDYSVSNREIPTFSDT